MPRPRDGESRDDFVSRCIPIVIHDGAASSSEQAVAICNSLFEKRHDAYFSYDLLRESAQRSTNLLEESKSAIPFHDYGTAEEGATWDSGAEERQAEIADLNKMCAWKASKPAGELTKGDFKLPHHRYSDKKAVWRGVAAAMGAIRGARGGVDIPSGDRRAVYNHLVKHYNQFDKEPPTFEGE